MSQKPVPPSSEGDRRHTIRCQCSMLATIEPLRDHAAEECEGKVEDMSEDGLSLILNRRFEPGTALHLILRRNDEMLLGSMTVRVARVLVQPDGEWLHGCKILNEPESQCR